MLANVSPIVGAIVVALSTIAGATAAVITGHIGETAYVALVTSVGFTSLGAFLHAIGVNTVTGTTTTGGTGAGT